MIATKRRGRLPTGNRKYHIKKIQNHHHEMVRRILLGHDNETIAKSFDVTTQTVSNVRNSDLVTRMLSAMNAARDLSAVEISKEIMEMAPIAAEVYRELMQKEHADNIRLQSARDIINWSAEAPSAKQEAERDFFTADDLLDLKRVQQRRALDSAKSAGLLEEAEIVEESK